MNYLNHIDTEVEVDLRTTGGSGGEKIIIKMFPGFERQSTPLYDAVKGDTKVEFKKISSRNKKFGLIDFVKLINLSEKELQIPVYLFWFDHDDGKVLEIFCDTYQTILDNSPPVLLEAAKMVKNIPSIQFKHRYHFINKLWAI